MTGRMKKYYDKIYRGSMENLIKGLTGRIDSGKGSFVVTANPEIFMMGKEHDEMNEALLDEDTLIVPDGIGVIKGGEVLGVRFKERIPGVEICGELLRYADKTHRSLYLFGAERRVLEALVGRIGKEYPGIELVGYTDGYIEDKDSVFRQITELEPDIVLVALGTPAQELLIHRFYRSERPGLYMGVGGSFDVLSGLKKRAPAFFIKCNLEWLYRITKEPKSLRRIWNNNVRFFFEIRKEKNGH